MRDFVVPSSANYTEFLRDYLINNTLPNALSDLDNVFECDFKEEFKQYYLMREIGFDTEELFKQKLNIQCAIMLPYYADKATKLKMLFTNIFENGYSITQTNNLSRGVSGTNTRSNTQTNNLTEGITTSGTRDTTNTKNLTETYNDNESIKHIDYKTPVGMSSDTLPYTAVSGGYTDNKNKVNATKANTGTDVFDEDTTGTSTRTNTGTVGNSENASNSETETNTGTITTVYSKNPRFNTLEALTKFQNEFCNIKLECLEAFECLFMQIF